MKYFLNRLSILFFLIILSLYSIGAIEQANPANAASSVNQSLAPSDALGGGDISVKSSSTGWQPAVKPWTEERMRKAIPYPLGKEINIGKLTTQLTIPTGKPGIIPSRGPQGSDISLVTDQSEKIISGQMLLAENVPYPNTPPYTGFKNFDSHTRFPYSTVGVLFFKQDGIDYQCTAASIGNDAVWTAGRCIHNGGGTEGVWSSDVVFVPAYRDGDEPYGQWIASTLWTKGQWFMTADPSFDMGGAQLNTNGSGQTISQVVGSLGFSYNFTEDPAWFTIGYPDDPPQSQYICSSSFGHEDTTQSEPYPVAMGCDMNNNAAGSPWISVFSGFMGSVNFLNGNSSYLSQEEPETIYSPYFGDAAKTLWDQLMSN